MKYAILNSGSLEFLGDAESPEKAYETLAHDAGVSLSEVSDLPIYTLTDRQAQAVRLWDDAGKPSDRTPACLTGEKKDYRTPLEKAIDAREWHRKNPGIAQMRTDHIKILQDAGEPII